MSLWRQLTRGLRVLTNRDAADRDLADEVGDYLERATAELVARGVPPDEARRRARLEVGNVAAVRDQVREHAWESVIHALATDVRYAARQYRRNPGFTATVILILALGIGAAATIFSVVDPILLEPLPYPHADRVTTVWERLGSRGRMTNFATYRGLAERSRAFDSLAVVRSWQPTRTGTGEPERLEGQRVTPGYFRALGVAPVFGRDFHPSDDRVHGGAVVILSHGLWQRLGGDPAIVGREIPLDGQPFTVVGVMPRRFENVLAPRADVWTVLQYDPALPLDGKEWGHHLRMVGRLRPGVSRNQARNELDAMAPALARMYAAGYAGAGGPPDGFTVDSLQTDVTADVRPALTAVTGAVVLVLIIACVNVTSLLVARGAQRRSEFAMRAALGAGRARLARQLLTEVLLLAWAGGAVGTVAAVYAVAGVVAVCPPELPRVDAIHVDRHVLAFAIAVTTIVAAIVGLAPTLHAFSDRLRAGIGSGSHGATGGRQGTRRVLVVAEVALALVLAVGAGLLFRSVDRLFAVSPGFDASDVLTMQVQPVRRQPVTGGPPDRSFERVLTSVRQLPGVETAAGASQLPLSGDYDAYGMEFEKNDGASSGPAFRYAVTPDYFRAMRIPLRRGRLLDEHDTDGRGVAIVISESFARREFADRDPLGARVHIGSDIGRGDRPWATIVGVAGDVKHSSLAVGTEDAFYVSTRQWPWPDQALSLVVRTRSDAAMLAPAVRKAIFSADKNYAVVRVDTMEHLVTASEARRRFALFVFEAFALVGLLLAATGIYGVLAVGVTERTRELGVRAALGASRGEIVTLVLRQGMALTGLGVAIGLGGAAAASRSLASLLFGVSRLDPVTYAGVAALLMGVAAIACTMPARRAAGVDPSVALRMD